MKITENPKLSRFICKSVEDLNFTWENTKKLSGFQLKWKAVLDVCKGRTLSDFREHAIPVPLQMFQNTKSELLTQVLPRSNDEENKPDKIKN